MSAAFDLTPLATYVPTLESAVLFSTLDGLPAGSWSREPGPSADRPAAHWAAVLSAVDRGFACNQLGERPVRVIMHAAQRTVAISTVDERLALVLTFGTRMSADWTEHYLRRACGEVGRLLGVAVR